MNSLYKLYDYQEELVKRTRKALTRHQGVLVVSPAGSGKSVVIAEIARLTTQNQRPILFIVHRKELADQIEASFQQNHVDMAYVTIMTVRKAANRLAELPEPSLIITDETHHSRAKSYQDIYTYFDQAYRLGFTASPWRLNGRGFDDLYGEMVEGPSVQWLIDHQFLAPYRYFAPKLADLSKLKRSSTGDFSKRSIDQAMKKAVFGDVVQHYQKLASGQQAILYAHSVQASRQLAKTFQAEGVQAVHADSHTPKQERAKIMDDFKQGNLKILCNVDLISEGFDVPDCQCVILVRPTASLVLHIQQSMRSMRYKPGKTATIIDHVGNYELHGLPNTERDWTLHGRKKQAKVKPRDDVPSVTECPHCFAVIPSGKTICPMCGQSIQANSGHDDLEQVDADLVEVDQPTFKADYRKVRLQRDYIKRKQSDLDNLEDWYCYAKSRGYKDGWLKYHYQPLQPLSWPQFYQTIHPYKEKYKGVF